MSLKHTWQHSVLELIKMQMNSGMRWQSAVNLSTQTGFETPARVWKTDSEVKYAYTEVYSIWAKYEWFTDLFQGF